MIEMPEIILSALPPGTTVTENPQTGDRVIILGQDTAYDSRLTALFENTWAKFCCDPNVTPLQFLAHYQPTQADYDREIARMIKEDDLRHEALVSALRSVLTPIDQEPHDDR